MAHYFGTDGIRGPIATSPFLTPLFLQRVGIALTRWAESRHEQPVTIVLGSDTRASCATIEQAIATGIFAAGGTCVSAGVLPTPALQRLVSNNDEYHYGIIISASHNPATDNGIKIITPDGKLTRGEEFSFSSLLSQTPGTPRMHHNTIIPAISHDKHAQYQSTLLSYFPENMLKGLTIALDCAHGATTSYAPGLFRTLGAHVVTTGVQPNGFNINAKCGSTTPKAIQSLVKSEHADFGFAFDGDGDRVIAVTQDGAVCDGNALLALLSTHPRFTDATALVGTIMSNSGLESWLEKNKKHLLRTPVGDVNVLHAMQETELPLGGEPSGHIIVSEYLPTSDGIFSALLALQTALLTNNHMMKTCDIYPQVLINLPVGSKQDLTHEPYASIIRTHTPSGTHGRSLVRYSGTEPVLRIMVEHKVHETADKYATQMAQALHPLLTK